MRDPFPAGRAVGGYNVQGRGIAGDVIVATGTSHGRSRPHVNRLPLKGIPTDCKKVTREGQLA